MKYLKPVLLYFFAVCCLLTFGFKHAPADKSAAVVSSEQGVYIFVQCKPVAEYEYLGTIKKSVALTGEPSEMLNAMLKKLKKDFPAADGIIFTSADMDKADAVKFK